MNLEEVINSIDIVEIASMYTELEQKSDEWWGISPITYPPEKTPSFSVRRDTGKFYDFSSGIGGGVITLIKYCENISVDEAIKKAEQYAGISHDDIKQRSTTLQATKICKAFSEKSHDRKQPKSTELSDDYMDRFSNAPSRLQAWRDEGISDLTMGIFGVKYDSFSDRIVYPIKNINGKIVNVGARTLDPNWKEKGLRKYSYYYQWGSMDVIYGLYDNLDEVKNRNEVIIFEGAKSVMKAYTWGIKNCGAALTSHLNPNQFKILVRLGVSVVFAFDKDVDPTKDYNIKKLKNYIPVYLISDDFNLIHEKDSPVDRGEDVFKKLYENKRRIK